MQEIWLENNQLTTLPPGLFDGLSAVEILQLNGNHLDSLPVGAFEGLSAVWLLHLHDNRLSSLPAGVFDGLTSLQQLLLVDNRLSRLPAGVFDGLSDLRDLDLEEAGLSRLPAGVFDGLSSLERLNLEYNQLSDLPADVFDGLSSLTELTLMANRLSSLPEDVFDGLGSLNRLRLDQNQLTSLPADVFDGLSSLAELFLHLNRLTSAGLPADVFDGLDSLYRLQLRSNQLTTLPDGVFEGLSALEFLEVQYNLVDPMVLAVSLERVGNNGFKATVPAGAPFPITLPVSVANGSIDGGATTLGIPAGAVESGPLTVTRTAGKTAAVTADIGPSLPVPPHFHEGYKLARAAGLPREILPEMILALSVADARATEGEDSALVFVVTLDQAASGTVTVSYATADGTAAAGEDYEAASGTLAFAAGETEKTVSVAITDDSMDEEDETLTLTLSSPANATLGDAVATGTIADDDEPPLTASFSGMPAEHDGENAFTFGLGFSEEVKLSYRTLRDQAFVVTGGAVRNVRRQQQGSNRAWEITVEPDSREAVTITLPGGRECGTSGAICTRGDNPRSLSNSPSATVAGPPGEPPTVSVADADAGEGAAVEFTVSLSAASDRQVTVRYATSGGTAESGADFTAASGTLAFGANETSKTVSVSTTDDSLDEENETFTLTLSSPTNATLGDATATGTIRDDDESLPTVSVSNASASEGDAVEFTVSLSAASGRQVTVEYATSGGTAESGTDFAAASGTLTFGANETSKTVSVSTTDDSRDEQDETFTLTLSSPANATLGDATATGTIIDNDDALPPLTASFEGMPASHDGANAFTFGLTFSEDLEDLSYKTLRDHAFDVAGGEVRGAKRQQQGSNQRWTITVKPSGNGDVTISLPQTTDCEASGAICTSDGRPLSNSPSATIAGPGTSSGSDGDEEDGLLALVEDVTPEAAAAALFGADALTGDQLAAMDQLGNRNGAYDLGDLLSWTTRCRRNELSCGGTVSATDAGSLPASPAMPPTKRQGRTPPRRRANGHAGRRSGRNRGGSVERVPRQRAMRSGVAGREPGRHGPAVRRVTGWIRALVLGLVVTAWGCGIGEDLVQPVQPDPGPLHVQLTVPPEARDIGAMLVVEGPGIDSLSAPGFELIQADEASSNRREAIIAGSLSRGPVLQVWVPDRRQLADYRVTLMQVSGDDYGLRDVAEYRAVITSN